MAKKITSAEFFDKNNAAFMKFGRMFTRKLTDRELINALAEKDLEKLADRKSTRLNSSHYQQSRMPSSA